jgi:DNA-directed RNA polymerase specialized sigma subunit
MTLEQVAERLGISYVRVCQIEKKIKNKLKTNPNLLKLFKN